MPRLPFSPNSSLPCPGGDPTLRPPSAPKTTPSDECSKNCLPRSASVRPQGRWRGPPSLRWANKSASVRLSPHEGAMIRPLTTSRVRMRTWSSRGGCVLKFASLDLARRASGRLGCLRSRASSCTPVISSSVLTTLSPCAAKTLELLDYRA